VLPAASASAWTKTPSIGASSGKAELSRRSLRKRALLQLLPKRTGHDKGETESPQEKALLLMSVSKWRMIATTMTTSLQLKSISATASEDNPSSHYSENFEGVGRKVKIVIQSGRTVNG